MDQVFKRDLFALGSGLRAPVLHRSPAVRILSVVVLGVDGSPIEIIWNRGKKRLIMLMSGDPSRRCIGKVSIKHYKTK
jgi:hypothetical protein